MMHGGTGHRWSVRILRILLGAVFAWSAVAKLQDLSGFHAALLAYELPIPDRGLRLITLFVPYLEGILGLALIANFWPETVRPAVWGLCSLFVVILLLSAARGLDIHCGCFGGRGAPLAVALGRAGLLCVLAFWLVLQPSRLHASPKKN
ncbi:MauE/DoxX family redox-associated membrane protein [Coraliomargarita sp. SDUM461003]|uniref:MauE/DoxX family redox-associated membrane protein n=1 Tax=Thalassobacterium maritimum TaxID=3041265 RepID=A0ABU1AWR9_9BACT|nr:MauE/DoxX family redox-associated membrane protein [Coraliomargarita sp. SDUM461003]MDQ8208598.1 MauE/DoxX family redox-associated membrane protein [Coraliomargarita sp. SDUM461003]